MKKRILTMTLLLMTVISYSFANNADDINKSVIASFKKDFADAREIKWENAKAFVKATFTLNEAVIYAYYTYHGDLIAVTRNIQSSQLPITQLVSLKKNYAGYWITDLFEIDSDNETSYYITLENSDYKLILKSNSAGWDVYKKEIKL